MLLTITTTHQPATDLGFLLHKAPGRLQTFELPYGAAHVFYPVAGPDLATAALLLEVDPVGLVRGRGRTDSGPLEQYVNDRPYVASSFLSVALSRVFGQALAGRSRERPELAELPLPLEARLAVLPCRGGEALLRRLFEPLGYCVEAVAHPLDEQQPEWGMSRCYTVTLRACCRLCDLLTHLYVLVPVLDDEKHYYVGEDEVDKLLDHGEGWLADHPERELITRRYLRYRRSLERLALERLLAEEPAPPEEGEAGGAEVDEQPGPVEPEQLRLNEQRLRAVVGLLKEAGVRRVLDLGCGEGGLLRELLAERSFEEIVGLDLSLRALEVATRRLRLDRLSERARQRIRLLHGSLGYRDERLAGFDGAALVEVIEHLDPPRLAACERVVFECARPRVVVVTTPNVEYNVRYPGLRPGRLRHRDHRFEWTRAQFREWAQRVAEQFGYAVRCLPIGPVDDEVGPPTQAGVFEVRPCS